MTNASVEVDGSVAKTVTVNWVVNNTEYVWQFQTGYSGITDTTGDVEGITTSLAGGKILLTGIAFGDKCPVNGDVCYTNGYSSWEDQDYGANLTAGDTLLSLTYTVAADTPAGVYTVKLNYKDYEDDSHGSGNTGSCTATITVTEPSSVVVPDYELYYTLGQTTDTEPDHYIEYNPGDDVVVSVYIKAKTAIELQAFDLFVANDDNLSFKSYVAPDGVNYFGTKISNSTDTLQHIQAVGYDQNNNPIGLNLPAGSGVKIAEITFTVSSTVVYNTGYDITITPRSNIAVANTPGSFTPDRQTVSSDILGVETLKQWVVTFYDGADAMTDPAPQTVGNSLTATEPATDPTKDGWTFSGWYSDSGLNTPFDFSTPIRANTSVYSKWTQQNYHVNWHWGYDTANNQYDDTKVYSDPTVYHYNDTATYGGSDTPVKPSTAEKNFSFIGWNTDQTATSELATLTVTGDTEFYAIFSETDRTYEVNFDMQGHGAAVSAQNVVYNGKVSEPDPAPTDTNYDFGGWYKEAACSNAWNFANDPITAEGVVLYAKWTPKTFTLNLIENDGTYVSPYTEPTTYTYGAQDALPTAAQIEKAGYTFDGWYADAIFTGSPITNIPADATGTQTFYAKWTAKTYNVTFNGNGATGTTAGLTSVVYGTPESLTDNGFTYSYIVGGETKYYTFSGWSATAKAIGEAPDYNAPYTTAITDALFLSGGYAAGDTITLYATWSQDDYAITYAGLKADTTNPNPSTYSSTSATVLTNPTTPGYTFTGWTVTVDGTDPAQTITLTGGTTIPVGTTGNLTATASWSTISYTITFNEDGGSDVGDTSHQMSYTIESTDTLPVTTKTGYTFQHWLLTGATAGIDQNWGTVNSSSAAEGASLTGKYGTVELTAVWQAKTVQLSFDPVQDAEHAGTLDPNNPIDVTYDGTYPSLPTPVPPAGYDFDGWYIGGDKIEAGDTVTIESDTTAVAHYIAHVYNITFDEAGGTAVSDLTYTIESTSVTIPSTSKDYYDFGGWSVTTDANGTWGSSTVPAGVKDLTGSDIYGDVTLTAIWTPKTYAVTLNENGGTYVDSYTEPTSYTYGVGLTLPTAAQITKDGYTFGGWYDNDGLAGTPVLAISDTESGAKEYWAKWTPNSYTITLELAGGSVTGNVTTINYTTDTGFTLPEATRANYQFTNWKVTANDAGDVTLWGTVNTTTWNAGTYTNDGTLRYYGNVTLTAQYTVSLKYELQTYKYAPTTNDIATNYKLLVVNAAGAGDGVYTYNGDIMYYTTDEYYQIEIDPATHEKSTGVFYTIVKESEFTIDKIVAGAGTKTGIADVTYDGGGAWVSGDINGDGVVNIADANAIFQMVVATGSYYSFDQLSILARLRADMNTNTEGQVEEYRASLEDVNAILNIINETETTEP